MKLISEDTRTRIIVPNSERQPLRFIKRFTWATDRVHYPYVTVAVQSTVVKPSHPGTVLEDTERQKWDFAHPVPSRYPVAFLISTAYHRSLQHPGTTSVRTRHSLTWHDRDFTNLRDATSAARRLIDDRTPADVRPCEFLLR